MPRTYIRADPSQRFMSFVDTNGPIHPIHGQCWVWTGSKTFGYGYFSLGRGEGNVRVHRLMWEWENGHIPDGLHVLHRCDNSACVNPNHLFLGTQKDNMNDMSDKGRRAFGDAVASKGEANPKAKLTEKEVKEIKRLRPTMSLTQLATIFGVHIATIKRIMNGKRWRHV